MAPNALKDAGFRPSWTPAAMAANVRHTNAQLRTTDVGTSRSIHPGGRANSLPTDPAARHRIRPDALAEICGRLHADGDRRGLHGCLRLSHGHRGQRSLRQPQLSRHRDARISDDGDFRHQGRRVLWPGGDDVAHRQPHHRRKPAAHVRPPDAPEPRLLRRAPFVGISGAAVDRRQFGDAGSQSSGHRHRPRFSLAGRPRRW